MTLEYCTLYGQDVAQNDGMKCCGAEDHSYMLKYIVNMRGLSIKSEAFWVQGEAGIWYGLKTWTSKQRGISYEDWFEAPLDVKDLSCVFSF